MADDFTILNNGQGGDTMDETGVDYGSNPTRRKRPRVVLTGEGLSEIARVLATQPTGTEYGVTTRPLVGPYPGTEVVTYSTLSALGPNAETTVVSYTVGAGKTFYFLGFMAIGDVDAIYRIFIGSSAKLAFRTSVSGLTAEKFYQLPIFTAAAAQIVYLKVMHCHASINANFEGTLIGYAL